MLTSKTQDIFTGKHTDTWLVKQKNDCNFDLNFFKYEMS